MDLPGADAEKLKARLRELNQDLIERDRLAADARKQVRNLTELLRQQDANLEAHQREIANLTSWTEDLRVQILAWKSAFHGVVESKSWKVMGPARFLGRILRGAQQGTAKAGIPPAPQASKSHKEVPLTAIPANSQGYSPSAIEALRDRRENLEQAFQEFFATATDTTGGGRYIHPVNDRLSADFLQIKAIAFYETPVRLPGSSLSAHVGPANWIDVSKAAPRYVGHYQPHIPDELGYYDSRVPEVFSRQVELATQYGIYGFCFRIETSGSEIAGSPLDRLLSDQAIRIAFCLSCASGAIVDSSLHSSKDFLQFVARLFNDQRYIRVEGKPLLVLSGIHEGDEQIRQWRTWAASAGFPGLYVIAVLPAELREGMSASIDSILRDPTVETMTEITSEIPWIDPQFRGRIYSYSSMVESDSAPSAGQMISNVVTGWDSEPQHPGEGLSFAGSSPGMYARWLERSCSATMRRAAHERFLFITSWNNWGAGAHLEPDRRFGYGYLHATANVLRYYYRDASTEALIGEINSRFSRTSEAAVIFHCFYEDLIDPILERYLKGARGMDLFVTVRSDVSRSAIERMRKAFPNIFFLRQENRGRDMRPFLFALRHVQSLGYRFACKIHTKKTPHGGAEMGNVWRQKMLDQLLGAGDSTEKVLKKFQANPRLGLLIPKASVENLAEIRHHIDNTFWLDRLLPRLNRPDLIGNYAFSFPAGSMYWFRIDALDGLDSLMPAEDSFEIELGQRDGTLAHALERLVILYAQERGYSTDVIDVTEDSGHSPISTRHSES
jgi:hypothetical protein